MSRATSLILKLIQHGCRPLLPRYIVKQCLDSMLIGEEVGQIAPYLIVGMELLTLGLRRHMLDKKLLHRGPMSGELLPLLMLAEDGQRPLTVVRDIQHSLLPGKRCGVHPLQGKGNGSNSIITNDSILYTLFFSIIFYSSSTRMLE